MSKKKDAAAKREQQRILRAEREREEILAIFEEVRQKIFEEHKIHDLDELRDVNQELSQRYKALDHDYRELGWKYVERSWKYKKTLDKCAAAEGSRDLAWSVVIGLSLTLVSIIVSLLLYICSLIKNV